MLLIDLCEQIVIYTLLVIIVIVIVVVFISRPFTLWAEMDIDYWLWFEYCEVVVEWYMI